MQKILAIEEVPKRLAEFKDIWYVIAQKCEGLSNYRSGFVTGFKDALFGILSEICAAEEALNDVCTSAQHHVPKEKENIEGIRCQISKILKELKRDIERDTDAIKKYEELKLRFEEVSKSLEAMSKRYEELKKHTAKTCEQYAAVRDNYEQKIANIKEATDKEIDKIRKEFMDDVSTIFDGYEIVTRGKQERIGLDLLLERLIQDSEYYQKVDVVHKAFLGRRKSDIEARLLLLKYKADEISKKIAPIMEEESRRIAKFEPEFKLMKDVEMQCRDLKDEERALSDQKNSLRSDVDELASEVNKIADRFDNYNNLLNVIDGYIKKFGETAAGRKELSEIVDRCIAVYEPVEKDVEKRELRIEVRALKNDIQVLNRRIEEHRANEQKLEENVKKTADELRKITEGRDALQKKLDEKITELEEKKRQLEDASEKLSAIELKYKNLDSEYRKLSAEKEAAEMALKNKIKILEEVQEEAKKYKSELGNLQSKYSSLEAEHEKITSELDEVRAEVAKLEQEVASRIKSLQSRKTPKRKRAEKKEEEIIVEQKIDALREKKN